MYKHILIPTDGSELSEKAIKQGLALAKSIGAKVTAITVSETFHTFSVDPVIVTDTPKEYQTHCDARAEKYLSIAKNTAKDANVAYEGMRPLILQMTFYRSQLAFSSSRHFLGIIRAAPWAEYV